MARSLRSALLVAAASVLLAVVAVACGHHSHGGPGSIGTITVSPASVTLQVTAGGAPVNQAFTATAHLPSGDVDVTNTAFWSLDDYNLGDVINGYYTSITSHGGMTLVHARWTPPGAAQPLDGSATLTLGFHASVTSTCPGCTAFPPDTTPACGAGITPTVVYPPENVLLPPNMNVIETEFTTAAGLALFEVDFQNSMTDVRVETQCNPITDTRGYGTEGCSYSLDPQVWNYVAQTNRGGEPVNITVRGTDAAGSCIGVSNTQHVSFASEDLVGGIYYWQSIVVGAVAGKAGGIFRKDFGDPTALGFPFLTPASGSNKCYGCHFLSRDGARMTVESDDADSDDEYNDVTTQLMAIAGTAGTTVATGLPPGFTTFAPLDARLLASDGRGTIDPPVFFQSSGLSGAALANASFPSFAGKRVTQPDWAWDGTYVYFVVPGVIPLAGYTKKDDEHFSGGSIYRMSWNATTGVFGSPQPIVTSASADENDYYPAISPDGGYLMFDKALGTNLEGHDSFNNPNARLYAFPLATTHPPIELANADGGGVAGLSNSWPRWSPFVSYYKNHQLLWVTFSSTRDYGYHVQNQGVPSAKGGPLVNCYPPDSPENPTGSHTDPLPPNCNQPQIWMAAIDLDALAAGQDGSYPAFWLPFQDVTAHNHIAQWVTSIGSPDKLVVGAGAQKRK